MRTQPNRRTLGPCSILLGVAIVLSMFAPCVADSPGTLVGYTTWDQQHFGSTGRQVSQPDPAGQNIQCVWTKSSAFTVNALHRVHYNRVKVFGSPVTIQLDNLDLIDVLPLTSPATSPGATNPVAPSSLAGYPNLRTLPTGRAAVSFHESSIIQAAIDNGIGVGIFTVGILPAPPAPDSTLYPRIAVDVLGVHSDTIIHAIGMEADSIVPPSVAPVGTQRLYYWRGILSGSLVTWGSPVLIDTTSNYSAVIEQSPVSDEVAIVYTKPRAGASDHYDNGVLYRRSTDGGLTWGPADVIESMAPSGRSAFADLDAVYDMDNTLHVMYNTVSRDAVARPPYGPTVLLHWDNLSLSRRGIASGAWWNTCSATDSLHGGTWDLRMAKPNLIVKPAGAGPGAGIADELIYAVWVQYGPTTTDCATRDSAGTLGGYVNGDLWCSISSDDGLTWDWPQNLTGTETPDCLPGDCQSEAWVTAAAYADSGIYVSYINDTHAGASILGQGTWQEAQFRVYAPAVRSPVSAARIAVSPIRQPYPKVIGGNEYFIGVSAAEDADSSFLTFVRNRGNATLNFQMDVLPDDGGTNHVQVNGQTSYLGSVSAAGIQDLVIIDYSVAGLNIGDTRSWRVRITSNDPVYDTIHLNIIAEVRATTADIIGAKFHDLNGDGIWDTPGEPGLEGWVIHAEPGGYVDTTDATGSYFFLGLPAGTYTISEDQRPGWSQVYPGGNGTYTVALGEGQQLDSLYFGNREGECPIMLAGDVDESGTITSSDIISTVNFVFKGGIEPRPCAANADVNCSSTVTSSDIIHLVNFVFKGEEAPCDICSGSDLIGEC